VSALSDAHRTVLVHCLGLAAGEDVVVVTDPAMSALAGGFVAAARALGAEAVMAEMSERPGHGAEPPAAVAAAMCSSDVVVALTSWSLSHTEARRAACDAGARVASMPKATAEMLARTLSADTDRTRALARAVAAALSAGAEVRVTSGEGTDVTFDISGREAIADDGDLSAPGAFGNLPFGEGFVAPREGRTTGRIVFDGAVAMLGAPLVVLVEDGYAVDFEGDVGRRLRARLEANGPEALAVAELGIGTNPAARLSGNVLEDEKILGTVHVAFGDNHTFGGTLRVASHQDVVVLRPRVLIDGSEVLADGRLELSSAS